MVIHLQWVFPGPPRVLLTPCHWLLVYSFCMYFHRLSSSLRKHFVLLDVSSFTVSLDGRCDASFLCGAVSRYIHQLWQPSFDTRKFPAVELLVQSPIFQDQWGNIYRWERAPGPIQLVEQGRNRQPGQLEAEGIHFSQKQVSGPSFRAPRNLWRIPKSAAEAKTDFAKDVLHFIRYLLSVVLQKPGLANDLGKGLVAFYSFILFKRPTEVALRHFDLL